MGEPVVVVGIGDDGPAGLGERAREAVRRAELLAGGRRREAIGLAPSLFGLILAALGGLTALFVLVAPAAISLAAPGFDDDAALRDLTITLARLMFPIVVLLGLSGLVVGMLNSFEHFSVPALAPLAWNVVIIGALVGLTPAFPEEDEIYAYAIGVLAGTVVQFLLPLPWLRGTGGRFTLSFDWRNPHVIRVMKLMLPVTIALGLINFSLLINSLFGTLVQEEAPAAIDKAFRIYMLPQGMFSVAVATVIFPTLSRFAARRAYGDLRATMANGVRQICLLLIPAAVLSFTLAEPITRLIYEHGAFGPGSTELVSSALVWFSLSLPLNGANLLLTRTFFSFQRPWLPTAMAAINVAVNVAVSAALYAPLGIPGIVVGTLAGNVVMTAGQVYYLRRELRGFEGRRTALAVGRMLIASALLGAVAYLAWRGLDQALGRALYAQVVSVGTGCLAGVAAYAVAVAAMRIPEGRQLWNLLSRRPTPR